MNSKIGEAASGATQDDQPCNPLMSEDTQPMERPQDGELDELIGDVMLAEAASQNLTAYIEWANRHFKHIRVYSTGGADGVPGLQIRFDALRQSKFRPLGWWENLQQNIEDHSDDTAFAMSEGSLFVKGILNLGISSQNYGYRESLVVDMLEWLFDEVITD